MYLNRLGECLVGLPLMNFAGDMSFPGEIVGYGDALSLGLSLTIKRLIRMVSPGNRYLRGLRRSLPSGIAEFLPDSVDRSRRA